MAQIKWNKKDLNNGRETAGTSNLKGIEGEKAGISQGYQHGSLTRGLVAYYPMDTGSGSTLYDKALNNNGTINGATWNGTGKVGSDSLKFDGTDDYIDLNPLLKEKSSFTIASWIYKDSEGNWSVINSNTGTSSGSLSHSLRINTNDKIDFAINDGSNFVNVQGSSTLSKSEWHHILGLYKKSEGNLKIYYDGDQDGKTSTTITPQRSPKCSIGRSPKDGRHFHGKIDDLRFYNRALSTPEIKALYNSGNGIKSKLTPGDTLL